MMEAAAKQAMEEKRNKNAYSNTGNGPGNNPMQASGNTGNVHQYRL
jgi:hypothetical protein